MEAIARMNFAPNPMAQSLKRGRSMTIGIVVQDISSPFFDETLHGVDEALKGTGYASVIVSGHWNAAAEARCIEVLRSRRVDGIIVLTGRLTDAALKATARQLPVVATGRTLKAPGLFSLAFDNMEGGRLATRHLLELGHQRIAFIAGDADHPDANDRHRGYRQALEDAGIAPDTLTGSRTGVFLGIGNDDKAVA